MKTILSWLFVALWMTSVVNAMVSQLEVLFFGTVLIPVLVFKVALIAIPIASWMIWPFEVSSKSLLWPWFFFAACVMSSAASVYWRGAMSPGEQVVSLLTNYLYFFVIPFFAIVAPPLCLKQLSKGLCFVFVPLAVLGIAQYWSNDPIVSLGTIDQTLSITSWSFYERVRGFSLFASGLDFGLFLAIAMALFTAYALQRGAGLYARALASCGLLLGAVATYTTLTRSAYIFVPVAMTFSAFLSRRKQVGRKIWIAMPILALLLGITLIIVVPLELHSLSSSVLEEASLFERLLFWKVGLDTWLSTGSATFWFGNGVAQGISQADYIVDNTFLNFAVQSGVVGLCGALYFLWAIWMSLRERICEDTSPEAIALIAVWGTFLLTGMFNVTNYFYGLAILPLIAADGPTWASRGREIAQIGWPHLTEQR